MVITCRGKLCFSIKVSRAELGLFWVSSPLCLFPTLRPSIFSDYSFCVNHPANQDERRFLALAMASELSVPRLFSQREPLIFCYGSNSTRAELWLLIFIYFLITLPLSHTVSPNMSGIAGDRDAHYFFEEKKTFFPFLWNIFWVEMYLYMY
jgi:hypothetical protein